MNKKYALCIGINSYPDTDCDLSGCVNDAQDWAFELRSRGFVFETLLDGAATGSAIRDALTALTQRAKPGDVVFVTFSGHGSFVVHEGGYGRDGMDGCWCPYDVVEQGPITDEDLKRIFSKRMGGVRWVVLSDSCHSGTVRRFVPGEPDYDAFEDRKMQSVRFLAPSVFDDRLDLVARDLADARFQASPPGRDVALLMSGCEEGEYSYDTYFRERPNGAFTHAALTSLRELGGDASYLDWHHRLREYLPSSRFPQTPQLHGDQTAEDWQALRFDGEDEHWASAMRLGDFGGNVTPISFPSPRERRSSQGKSPPGIMRQRPRNRIPSDSED
ncbi:MAG: caspase family protein [Pseudomonadota bacterium]